LRVSVTRLSTTGEICQLLLRLTNFVGEPCVLKLQHRVLHNYLADASTLLRDQRAPNAHLPATAERSCAVASGRCNAEALVRASPTRRTCDACAHLASCGPKIICRPKADFHEKDTNLNPRAQRASQWEHPIAATEAAKDDGLVGDFLLSVGHAYAKEDSVRLGGDAMDSLVEC
jgi:hypothetical protein